MQHVLHVLAIGILLSLGAAPADHPVEVGAVQWSRELDAALEKSAATSRPVFLLFQKVPGCAGGRAFGRTVLSHPLLVEAIEVSEHGR